MRSIKLAAADDLDTPALRALVERRSDRRRPSPPRHGARP
jgi:hypothetical protein